MKSLKAAVLTFTMAGLAACLGCAAEPPASEKEAEAPAAAPTKSPKESGSTAAKKKDPFAADKTSKDPFSDF